MADDPKTKAAEMMKKVLTIGVGTLFLTEESLRGLISEFKLPKELLGTVLDSANRTRKEFLQSLSQEVMSKVGSKIDPMAFMEEFLSRNEIDLQIKISVKPKKNAAKAPEGEGGGAVSPPDTGTEGTGA